jgi:hypothetical protein
MGTNVIKGSHQTHTEDIGGKCFNLKPHTIRLQEHLHKVTS